MTRERAELVLVGTPLGNREDLSPRARAAILDADLLLCEDTRSPRRLLPEGALAPRVSCFVGNEHERVGRLLEALEAGSRVVFVCEAGMPVWSDPGAALVRAALEHGHRVDVVPGPSAVTAALALAGWDAVGTRFLGFMPRKGIARTRALAGIARAQSPTVLFEAGNRVPQLLADLAMQLPDAGERECVLAREMTKMHQETLRGTVSDLAGATTESLRGEVTVVVAGAATEPLDVGHAAARAVLDAMLNPELKPRERARRLAEATGLEANAIYDRLRKSR